jgi:hypothetical protein
MKFSWLVGISMAAGISAQARDCKLTVNVRDTEIAQHRQIVELAEALAATMFREIDVEINWRSGTGRSKPASHSCGAPIMLSIDGSAGGAPVSKGAFAYAMPFGTSGTLIHIFMNRITGSNRQAFTTILLAHVMVHEITHVLEKTGEHSPEGIMKAHWEHSDLEHMKCRPLPFAERDIELLHFGLARYSRTPVTE